MTARIQLGETVEGVSPTRLLHSQETPAAEWLIVHTLGSKPPVQLFLTEDPTEPVHTDVSYLDLSTIVVSWPAAVAGWAYY